MFDEFFNNCEMYDPVTVSEDQHESIKSSLQKRLSGNSQPEKPAKEKKTMKASFKIRTILVAAVAALGAVSIAAAASTILTKEQIRDELAEKNSFTEELTDKVKEWSEYAGREITVSPTYDDVVVTKLIVTESDELDFKCLRLEKLDHGITLRHDDLHGGISRTILPNDNGGYCYYDNSEAVEDEQLLEAIAEGTELYGDTFTIWY